jgi:NAD+ synthase (glutamine-hydrolysing)
VVGSKGELIAEGLSFEEDIVLLDIEMDEKTRVAKQAHEPFDDRNLIFEQIRIARQTAETDQTTAEKCVLVSQSDRRAKNLDSNEEIYRALTLGTKDYICKNGFNKICIGLSGGIDSALVASIAVDAVGKENVAGIFMPSPFTSKESRTDAYDLAANLGMQILEVPITPIYDAYLASLNTEFQKCPSGIAEENIQARIRGNILMGFSNKFGWLVLTTGNKSEMSVGYATLYGDMAGGFAPIKDVPKTLVYKLCEWKNRACGKPVIPSRILTKEPTAELKPDQKDTDSLPPYAILDPVLKAYIEDYMNHEEIVSLGFDGECVRKIIKLVDASEYKRRQSPPGVKITRRSFGRDRRFPITNKYRSC